MTTRTYKDNFTLDGRLKVVNGVTKAKVSAVKNLYEKRSQGDHIASAQLTEAFTTSDAVFNFAHFASINMIPNYDDAPNTWSQIANTREVSNFQDVTLYSLNRSWTDGTGPSDVLGGGDPQFVSPVIPEATPYPYAYISGQNSQGVGIKKRGFKTDITFEALTNDAAGVFDMLPDEMLNVALDTDESSVYEALIGGGKLNPLGPQTLPNGDSVVANNALTPDAILAGILQLSERTVNGSKIRVTGGYNLIVPVGMKVYIDYQLGLRLGYILDGNKVYNASGLDALGSVTVIESEYLTGTEWFLLPKKGATRRPVLDKLELRGYRTPQLFVDNRVGTYLGSASVSPFEGSFDNDTITLKLRQFTEGVVWDGGIAIVYSNGTGTA